MYDLSLAIDPVLNDTSRCLCGALNGNVVVMKSMVADITDSTNMPQAYGYIPFAWQAGIALG
jgi:hypothetical protein